MSNRLIENLFREGDKSNSFYIIYSGEVEVSAVDTKLKNVKLISLPAGSITGEISFFDEKVRTASVKATTDTRALLISQEAFQDIEEKHPQLALKLVKELGKILSERLRVCDKVLINQATIKVNNQFLLTIAEESKLN